MKGLEQLVHAPERNQCGWSAVKLHSSIFWLCATFISVLKTTPLVQRSQNPTGFSDNGLCSKIFLKPMLLTVGHRASFKFSPGSLVKPTFASRVVLLLKPLYLLQHPRPLLGWQRPLDAAGEVHRKETAQAGVSCWDREGRNTLMQGASRGGSPLSERVFQN